MSRFRRRPPQLHMRIYRSFDRRPDSDSAHKNSVFVKIFACKNLNRCKHAHSCTCGCARPLFYPRRPNRISEPLHSCTASRIFSATSRSDCFAGGVIVFDCAVAVGRGSRGVSGRFRDVSGRFLLLNYYHHTKSTCGRLVRALTGHTGVICALSTTLPGGLVMASRSGDETVIVWRIADDVGQQGTSSWWPFLPFFSRSCSPGFGGDGGRPLDEDLTRPSGSSCLASCLTLVIH